MPINVETMALNTATITITSGEDSAKVVYSPALVTEDIFMKLLALHSLQAIGDKVTNEQEVVGKLGKIFRELNETIVYLVREWEVYATVKDEEQGNPFPLEADRLPKLPLKIRLSVIYGIMADIRPESLAPQETGQTQK